MANFHIQTDFPVQKEKIFQCKNFHVLNIVQTPDLTYEAFV